MNCKRKQLGKRGSLKSLLLLLPAGSPLNTETKILTRTRGALPPAREHNHSTWRCHVLKQPKPTISMFGVATAETMFYALPDSLFKESLARELVPHALISVSGDGSIEATDVVKEVARIVPAHSQWKWEEIPNGDKAFVISLPSQQDLDRITGMEIMVRAKSVSLSVSAWKNDDISPVIELTQAWVHVEGVPHEQTCRFL